MAKTNQFFHIVLSCNTDNRKHLRVVYLPHPLYNFVERSNEANREGILFRPISE